MLYRRKRVDLLSHRKHDDSARVLSRRPADADASLHNTVNLTVPLVDTALLVVILDVSERRLVRQRTDRSGTECLTVSENNLTVGMRFTLIFTGKVQVDIRLLVSLESQERLKRNVKPVFYQLLATDRTDLIRHITSASPGERLDLRRIKVAVLAVGTAVMCLQRIDLRDTGHGRRERRSDRTSGAYQITVLVGLPHQFLCNDIHYGIAVGNDGIQLTVQSLLHDGRKLLAVHAVRLGVADVTQHLIGILNDRRALVRAHRCDLLTHIGNLAGIRDDNLLRLGASEILELL